MTETQTLQRVSVSLKERTYDIVVGTHILSQTGELIKPLLARPRIAIVTDENVAALHLNPLLSSLKAVGITADPILLPPGEGSKDFNTFERLLNRLLDLRLERSDSLIALGGGVIGDLTGFAASIFRRGINFIQIPTTLLAQVDSSVGGKTGINTKHGKNLIGSFHQPSLVIADTGILDTLPNREFLAGYAEVVKYGLLGDAGFFEWLEKNWRQLLAGDPSTRQFAVASCCRMKAEIVARDEREMGERALLNLGHTFGHAMEAATGFSDRLLHGEGVSIGMALAYRLSAKLGFSTLQDTIRVEQHLRDVGLPIRPVGATPETLVELMKQDKKVYKGQLTFILAHGIGKAFMTQDVPAETVLGLLHETMMADSDLSLRKHVEAD